MKERTGGKHLVFIGDSLTEYYDWQKRFPDHEVRNLGISGEPVEGLLDRRDIIRSMVRDPDYIFLMTGINNIAMEQYEIAAAYDEIVRNLTTWYKGAKVVVQSILPANLEWISNDMIRSINRRLFGIAREHAAEYLDIFSVFMDPKGDPKPGYLLEDGVHLAARGYEAWAKEVENVLKR